MGRKNDRTKCVCVCVCVCVCGGGGWMVEKGYRNKG